MTLYLVALAAALAGKSPSLPSPEPVTFEITHAEAGEPQIARILYLDEGTRESILQPPAPVVTDPQLPQPVRIVNADESGTLILVPAS